MCIRAGGQNELESVKNLMSMSLMAVISDVLDIDIDNIDNANHLKSDLKMDTQSRQALEAEISDLFDGLQINLNQVDTVGTLLELVVHNEFKDVAEYLPGGDFLQHPALQSAA